MPGKGIMSNGDLFWNGFLVFMIFSNLAALGVVIFAPQPAPVVIAETTVLPLPWSSSLKEIGHASKESPGVRFNVDVNDRIGNYHKLLGWVFLEDQQTEGQEVYVQFALPNGTARHYSTNPMRRPDVGTAFRNPLYDHSGFFALIPLEQEMDPDACTVRFVLRNRKGAYTSAIWKTGIQFSSLEHSIAPQKEFPQVHFNVDLYEKRGEGRLGYRYLCGWAFVDGQPTSGQVVYVQLENPGGEFVHYTTSPMSRCDVATAFGNPMYNASGFHAAIPLRDGLEIDDGSIRFVIRNRFGTYRSSIWEKRSRMIPKPGSGSENSRPE